MRLSLVFINAAALLLAAGLSLVAAAFAVKAVEELTEIDMRTALDSRAYDWAEVQADGLQVILSGTAPDEATRFSVLSLAGTVVDAARVIDDMQVTPSKGLVAPRFSAEILRNDAGISIIGLIPADSEREELVENLKEIDGSDHVSDLLQVAHYPVPDGWEDAIDFAVVALRKLPRTKISVVAGRVAITAISDSAEAKKALERELNRAAPPGLRLALNISAPRPVITPFTLRFLIDANGARFDACSADTDEARARILRAAAAAGLSGKGRCIVGMGTPSTHWAEAAEAAIAALAEIGGGSVTMSDADVTLVAAEGTNPALFDRVVGDLDAALPDVFALHAVLPATEGGEGEDGGTPEFTATLSPEGLVQLRGRLSDENLRELVDAFAKARFGSDSVYTATRLVDGLPPDWPVRVLAGIEALSLLGNGAVSVTPDALMLKGVSRREEASAEISGLLAEKLGDSGTFSLDITYRPPPEPQDTAPDPEVCEAELAAVQAEKKISFEPGSATIAADAMDTMDRIAEILNECGEIRLEIQGHTDSQGREVMNQQLSQARAQSVLNELRARRVLTSTYVAVGYGETQPIADNKTEEGREQNRRITFRLIRPEPVAEPESTLESIALDPAELETGTAQEPAGDPPHEPEHPETDNPNAETGG